jgi:hypothetical protein
MIRNPLTNRLIQVGGATHKELIKQGMWGGGDREKADQLIDRIDRELHHWVKTTLRPIVEDAYGFSRAVHPFTPDSLHEYFRQNPETSQLVMINTVWGLGDDQKRRFLIAIGATVDNIGMYSKDKQEAMNLFDTYIEDGHTRQDLINILQNIKVMAYIRKWKLEENAASIAASASTSSSS